MPALCGLRQNVYVVCNARLCHSLNYSENANLSIEIEFATWLHPENVLHF